MEPDIDKILSNRIRQTELRPVAWNKKVVWQNIQSEARPKRHYLFYYYAAAATISLLIYFASKQIPTENTPQVADAKKAPQQEATQPESPVISAQSQEVRPAPVAASPGFTATAPQKKLSTSSVDTPASAQQQMQSVYVMPEPVPTDIQLPEEITLMLEAVETPPQKIKPVVGIITESYSENITNVKRKTRLHKLEPSPAVPWEDPGNALVFTVRK